MGMLSDRVGRKPIIYIAGGVIVLVYMLFMIAGEQSTVLMGGVLYGMRADCVLRCGAKVISSPLCTSSLEQPSEL